MQVEKFSATFTVEGKDVIFRNVPMQKGGTYRQGGVRLKVTTGAYTGICLQRSNGARFSLDSITYKIAFPLTNAARILVPDTGRHFMDTFYPRKVMFKRDYFVSSAHMSTPFFAYMDGLERVTLAFGLMGKTIDTRFTQTSPGANKKFSLVVSGNECRWEIHKPYHENASLGEMTCFEDGFYQKEGEKSWFHALRSYAELWQDVHGVKPRANDAVYTPELCTWRVVNSNKLTHDWTVKMARECKKLGIGAMILDDGWFGVGLDSNIMKSDMGDWPRKIEGKYPDIVRTVKAIQKEGVKALLWYCPTGIGPESKIYEKVKDYLIVNEGRVYKTPGLFHTLCPRNPHARKIMVANLRKVLSYGVDGYKPDLFNYMPTSPCEADHEHDIPTILEATHECFRLMHKEARRHGRDLLFMAKNDEANVDFCQFAPAVRAGDSPYDPNILFLRCAYPNAFAPAVINDYLMLAGPETSEEIARCMIRQVTMGVPALSVDLLKVGKRQKAVLAAWLGFYNRDLMALHKAARIEPQDSAMTCWERVDTKGSSAVISVVHPGCMIERLPDVKRIFVLNATEHDYLPIRDCQLTGPVHIALYDHQHRKLDSREWKDHDSLPVSSAGYTEVVCG